MEEARNLLGKGAQINVLYVPPLEEDAGKDQESVRLMPSGTTPLHNAAENGSTAVASLLLQQGAIVNARDKEGAR